MSDNNSLKAKYKVSAFSEFTSLSALYIGIFVFLLVASLALYTWMAIPPAKVYELVDDADLFTEADEEEMLGVMKKISRDRDVNVMVVTVTDKGSDYMSWSESDSIRYAEDQFKELSRFEELRDNSGVLIFIEIDGGYRFFYIVTFGTARASITNEECDAIYQRQLPTLRDGDYSLAVKQSLSEIREHNFTSTLLIITYLSFIVLPIIAVVVILLIVARRKRTKITVDHKTYYDSKNSVATGDEDIFLREKVSVTYHSSGSGGSGFSGGGGGGFSGGGGGGGGGGGFGGGGGRF